MQNIVIINGHPDAQSLCTSLANKYAEGATSSGAACKVFHLHEMDFNPILNFGYRKRTDLEPCLQEAQQSILEAQHIVFVFPVWWGTFPALLKGFIDRVFLPGFMFQYRENSLLWDKHLQGKTARLITTMDAPMWYFRFIQGRPGHQAMKKSVLQFCGVKQVRITNFSPIKTSTAVQREKWLGQTYQLGINQK